MGFAKTDSYRLSGRVTSPDLYGMSGCGLWFLSGPIGSPAVRPRLAAIAIEWQKGKIKCIVATRLLAALAGAFDHLGVLPKERPR
jgi:hypothetical protein